MMSAYNADMMSAYNADMMSAYNADMMSAYNADIMSAYNAEDYRCFREYLRQIKKFRLLFFSILKRACDTVSLK